MVYRAIAIVAILLGMSGCAATAPVRPPTTEAEALARYGEPARRWDNGDGTTTLEFTNQPKGGRTYMLTVDAGGIVMRLDDALSEGNLARVATGMTRGEVSRLLGTHRSVQTFPDSGEEVWDWNIDDGYGGATDFNVHFIDGKVVRTSRTQTYPRGPAYGYPVYPRYGYSPYRYYGHPYPYRPYGGYYRGYRGYGW